MHGGFLVRASHILCKDAEPKGASAVHFGWYSGRNTEMPQANWQKPVRVAFGPLGTEVINGPFEALTLLTDRWPDMRGVHFVKARSVCRAAVDGRRTPEEARQHFEQAVSEAQLHIN
jgi:hypothetical protein